MPVQIFSIAPLLDLTKAWHGNLAFRPPKEGGASIIVRGHIKNEFQSCSSELDPYAGWWNARWCLFFLFFFLQTGEAAHHNSTAVTASLKETFLKHSSIYRQSKTSCLFPSQTLTEEHAVFIPHLPFVEEVFIYNAGLNTGLDGLEVVWQRLIIIICQRALQTLRRNAH